MLYHCVIRQSDQERNLVSRKSLISRLLLKYIITVAAFCLLSGDIFVCLSARVTIIGKETTHRSGERLLLFCSTHQEWSKTLLATYHNGGKVIILLTAQILIAYGERKTMKTCCSKPKMRVRTIGLAGGLLHPYKGFFPACARKAH